MIFGRQRYDGRESSRCAGLSDLGLSVSAWPKLASKGSQRLVSVGRAQAAAAMLISAALWLCALERISSVGRRLVGWRRGFRGPMLSGDVPAPRVVPVEYRLERRRPAKLASRVALLSFKFRSRVNPLLSVRTAQFCDGQRADLRRLRREKPDLCQGELAVIELKGHFATALIDTSAVC